jgi:MGT family glycosyltransferase
MPRMPQTADDTDRPAPSRSSRRVLLWTTPVDGHVNPGLPIARALVARGHEVRWYTGRRFRPAVEATGARFEPMQAATDPADVDPFTRFPQRVDLDGLAGFKFDLKHLFLDEVPGQITDVQRILRDFPADVVLNDTAVLGAGMLHELGGPSWATFGITALPIRSRDTAPFGTGLAPGRSPISRLRNRVLTAVTARVIFRDVQRHRDAIRARLGLPHVRTSVLESSLSPYWYAHSSTPAFEYPRRDLPEQVHFVGPLLPAPPVGFDEPAWWPDLDGTRPVVLVTQGTVATDLDHLVLPALRALAADDVLVVATATDAAIDAVRRALPANARVEPFIPFGALLPHVHAVVTNGGFGGVQFALAHGVPLVVAGTTEEKPEIAARVAWSGAGIDLRTSTPSPEQIRTSVRAVLSEPRYGEAARRIRAEYARHDAPEEIADLVERLAATGSPVLRDVTPAHTGTGRATPTPAGAAR